ncbi:hypothetical protein B0H14DRAFT_2583983 [Mycena olivaceomarginata]|nr:hypothetical protein B0H14DRAFT_2583983 [Mycena olivaceomarginata]
MVQGVGELRDRGVAAPAWVGVEDEMREDRGWRVARARMTAGRNTGQRRVLVWAQTCLTASLEVKEWCREREERKRVVAATMGGNRRLDPLTQPLRCLPPTHDCDQICSSPQRRKRFRDTAARVDKNKLAPSGRKLASLMVVHDVRHRWNYTHAVVECALLLKSAINSWVVKREELVSLNLNTTEWELLEKLGNLLEVCSQM